MTPWYGVLLIAVACVGIGVSGTFLGKKILHWVWEKNRAVPGGAYKEKVAKYRLLNLETEQEKAPVLFLGDSITENFPIQEFFPGKAYVNRGISGDRADWLWKRLEDNIYGIKPKKILLLIGVNDLNHDYGVELTYINYIKSVEMIRKNLPETELIISEIYPVNPYLNGSKKGQEEMLARNIAGQIKELNEKLMAYAKSNGMRFNRTAEVLADADGLMSKKYSDDGVHPNLSGYRVIAKYLREHFKF